MLNRFKYCLDQTLNLSINISRARWFTEFISDYQGKPTIQFEKADTKRCRMTVIALKFCFKLCSDFITLCFLVLSKAVHQFLAAVLVLFSEPKQISSWHIISPVTLLCEHHHLVFVFLGLWHTVYIKCTLFSFCQLLNLQLQSANTAERIFSLERRRKQQAHKMLHKMCPVVQDVVCVLYGLFSRTGFISLHAWACFEMFNNV